MLSGSFAGVSYEEFEKVLNNTAIGDKVTLAIFDLINRFQVKLLAVAIFVLRLMCTVGFAESSESADT